MPRDDDTALAVRLQSALRVPALAYDACEEDGRNGKSELSSYSTLLPCAIFIQRHSLRYQPILIISLTVKGVLLKAE